LVDIEDRAALLEYLRRSGRMLPDEVPAIRTLAGGVSNKTVLVERPTGEAWVLKQALPKLRVAVDWFSDPSRIGREAEALRRLPELAPPDCFTPLVFEDPEQHLLAMVAVPQPHENWKSMLLAGRAEARHVRQFARLLGRIHRESYERRGHLAAVFHDRSFFESLRVEPYYEYAAAQVPAAAQFVSDLVTDTRARRLALVHGDYSPKNVLVRDGQIVLLDHEVIHWGDPAFDVGFALTHLLSKAHHLRAHRVRFRECAKLFWHEYRGELSETTWLGDLDPFAVRHTLGCLLARAAGRSPLEYLTEPERERQRDAVVSMMEQPPGGIEDLVKQFLERV
jgi:aminoglycoside phosphotransferase (APT) family kinase protein